MSAKTLLLVLVLCLTGTAAAQQAPSEGTGRLSGTVTDPLGLSVAGTRITIKGKRLNKELFAENDGTYSIDLPPGTYSVRFKHPGFLTVRKRLRIERDAVAKHDVAFRLDPKNFVTVY